MNITLDLTVNLYQIVSTGIAIISLVLSIRQTYLHYKESKRRLTFGVMEIFAEIDCVCVKYWAYSGSSKPINITRVQAIYGNETFDAIYLPSISQANPNLKESSYGEKSDKLPLYLDPYGSHNGFLAFLRPQSETDPRQITLKITTGEEKPVTVTLFSNSTAYIERKIKKINHDDRR